MLDLIAELIVSSLEWTGEKKIDLILDFTELCAYVMTLSALSTVALRHIYLIN